LALTVSLGGFLLGPMFLFGCAKKAAQAPPTFGAYRQLREEPQARLPLPAPEMKAQEEKTYEGLPSETLPPGLPEIAAVSDEVLGQPPAPSGPVGVPTTKAPMMAMATPATTPPPPSLNKDAYYSSTYLGGRGQKARLEKLIREGVVLDGQHVRLEAFTRDYGQSFPLPQDRALALAVDLERTKILEEGGRTYLQVGLQGIKREAPKRPPLNVALVIDRSGSMGDEGKLEAVKQAAVKFVEGITSSDFLAVVCYDDAVQVLFPSGKVGGKTQVKQLIWGLRPGGGTNIYAGLRAGYRELRKHYRDEGVNVVLLLSDGQVTVGVQDLPSFRRLARGAFEEGLTTTAIGVGLEFNEELMLEVARAGKGNYHFIQDAASIDEIFQQEFQALTHIVAKALRLRIKLHDQVQLVKIFGAQQLTAEEVEQVKAEERHIDRRVYEELGITPDRQKQPEEPGVKILIPHFYLGDSHVVMMEIAVPSGKRTLPVAEVFLKYKDLVFRKNREEKATVTISYTRSKEEMVRSIQRSVKKNLLGFQTGEVLIRAAALLDEGRNAEAVKLLDEHMVVLGVAAREWQDQDLDHEAALLGQYKDFLARLGSTHIASSEAGRYLRKSLTYSGYQLTR